MTNAILRDRRMVPTALTSGAIVLLGVAFAVLRAGPAMHQGPHPGVPHVMAAAARPGGITATKISEEKLAHVPGKTVTVEIVEFPPGAVAPEHHHAGSVTVYVLEGTVRSQIAGGPLLDYAVGQSFFEPPGAVHVVAANPSPTEKARFMAIHVADDGAQLTTYH